MSEASAPPARARGGRGRGGQGRGRGRGGNSQSSDLQTGDAASSARGGRRGGRGASRGTIGVDGNRIINAPAAGDAGAQAKLKQGKRDEEKADKDDVEAEVCFICASPVVHNSVAPCNHRTCHICALRMRALYKTKDCAHCRTPAQFVVFTDDATKRYEDFSDSDITFTDKNNGIRYEGNEIMEDTVLLLRYNCPDGDCDVACLGWPDLHRHVRAVHHKKICDLCSRHKKIFTHEHELFTDQELTKHMRKGDDNPGAIDQSGFKGHPECGFCRQRFYGDDELYVHCREKHERCFICDQRGGQPQYYVDYNSLEQHFRKDHFPCLEKSCQEKKFVVFPSEMDLKAHQLAEHGDTLSKDVRRDARVVDISSFDYRAPYIQERRGGSQREQRESRGRGRGRDPNAEPIPASSAQPLPRDQQAFQRQMAIHSAQSASTRTFGGQLTATPTPPSARTPQPPAASAPRPSSSSAEGTASNLEGLNLTDLSPQDRARQLRHREVIERASTLLRNDESSIRRFRSLISSYQSSSITAPALVDSFFSLFADSSNSVSTLVREVADLFEDKKKADTLRKALNDWRAINEDYPSLPGGPIPSDSLPLNWATTSASSSTNTNSGTKSNRVLKLKSSTAQSSRSSVSQTRSWGSAATAPTNSNRFAFPELPSSSRPQTSNKITTVPWTQSSSAPSSNPSSAPTSRPGSTAPGSSRGGAKIGADAFPSLPAAQKPQMTLFGYGNGRAVLRDSGKQSTASAWGGGGGSSASQQQEEPGADEEDSGKGKKKGNKGKKQVLMNWG